MPIAVSGLESGAVGNGQLLKLRFEIKVGVGNTTVRMADDVRREGAGSEV
jgi:hypothetical protein